MKKIIRNLGLSSMVAVVLAALIAVPVFAGNGDAFFDNIFAALEVNALNINATHDIKANNMVSANVGVFDAGIGVDRILSVTKAFLITIDSPINFNYPSTFVTETDFKAPVTMNIDPIYNNSALIVNNKSDIFPVAHFSNGGGPTVTLGAPGSAGSFSGISGNSVLLDTTNSAIEAKGDVKITGKLLATNDFAVINNYWGVAAASTITIKGTDRFASCPDGYFMTGMHQNTSTNVITSVDCKSL